MSSPLPVLPTLTNVSGSVRLGVPLPPGLPKGAKAAVQWLFETTRDCPGSGPFNTREAVEITIL